MADEKTFRVIGTCPVLTNEPGSTFKETLSEVQEKRLIDCGALEVVGATVTKPKSSFAVSTPEE